MQFNFRTALLSFSFPANTSAKIKQFLERHSTAILLVVLSIISIVNFIYYYNNHLDVVYNDARSHLDIGRRVVDNLKPGFAQLGSVWLPLPHLLMTLTIWNDFMWHSGLAGAIFSMIAFVATGIIINLFLKQFNVGIIGRLAGVLIFALNINIMYMQSTAMTELLLLATMTAGAYELTMWHKEGTVFRLIKTAFWIMLSTLIRYDGWFLFVFATGLVLWHSLRKNGYKTAEGTVLLFCTLGGFGIFLWLLWNQMIFKDAFYFAFGPYSAHTQQMQLEQAGALPTEKNFLLSLLIYAYAVVYNTDIFVVLLACVGAALFWFDKRVDKSMRIATIALLAPFFFNVTALYFGHSVLYVQGLSGNSWFNVRYGLMMIPTIAIFVGYLIDKAKSARFALLGLILFVMFFAIINRDAVTIDDAAVGASGKNVKQVSQWLADHAANKNGHVLISVASHDAIIFSSGLPMTEFIHEGTGTYWDMATAHPDRWARWIVMRTYDPNDQTYKILQYNPELKEYTLIHHFPFADIYELKQQYVRNLQPLPKLAQTNK